MKKRLTPPTQVFLGLALSLAAARAGADDVAKEAEILSKFDQYRHELKSVIEAPVLRCDPWEASDPRSSRAGPCSFNAICSQLQQNEATAFLYQNSAGQAVPNYALWQAEERLHQCYDSLSAKLHPPDPASGMPPPGSNTWIA